MSDLYIPYLDDDTEQKEVQPCADTNGDLVGLGFRVGLYMLGISHLVIYARGASSAAAGQSQLTMISYFAVFVTLYTHGVEAITDIEFVTISYLLGLFGIIAHVDFHAYLAHGGIKAESVQHRLYFVFRFLLVTVTSIFTWGMLLAFWATEFREIRCGTEQTSAFLFAQVPAYGVFRPIALIALCLLFLHSVLAALYTALRLAIDFAGYVEAARHSARANEDGTLWPALGDAPSRRFSKLLWGAQKLAVMAVMALGAELTIKWNKVPFVGDVYELGQVLFLHIGLFALLQSVLVPAD